MIVGLSLAAIFNFEGSIRVIAVNNQAESVWIQYQRGFVADLGKTSIFVAKD
jgi:hypothetical protein